MLRVRPIHFTSRLDEWERLLTALGMVKTVDEPTWQEFDAGSGRLALHFVEEGSAEDGNTSFGVEVGDLKEFARRTTEAGALEGGTAAGTTAELIEADHGSSCRITAADGFSFLADPATRAADDSWGGSPEADPGIAVVGVWFAEDAVVAAQTLRKGEYRRPAPPCHGYRRWRCRHGRIGSVHREERRHPDARRRHRGRECRSGLRIRGRSRRPARAPQRGGTRGCGHRGGRRPHPSRG